jgi:hypothetical protein
MSFSDRPSYGSWQQVGCFILGFVLLVTNALFLAFWYLTFWDLSTGEYRSLVLADLIVPAVWLVSIALLRLYVRLLMRDTE